MSINATSSSVSSSSAATSSAQVSSASNSENAKKSSTDSSFKEEMDKVSSSLESKVEDKDKANSDKKVDKVSEKTDDSQKDSSKLSGDKTGSQDNNADNNNLTLEGQADYSKFASLSMNDVNSMLSNDIQAMMNSNSMSEINAMSNTASISKNAGMLSFDFSKSITMDQNDADFFINLTQKNDVSMQNVVSQAQNMVNQGASVSETNKNVQVSQTLLNALANARETNQPIRIDFDQNVSVVLRVGKDGAIAANFIPGDKAVEQYLKSNIESLKATFNQNDLPYSDLSYSNRGSKQQKENRRNK